MAALGNPEMLTRKIKLWDINAHITCRLCEGYLIDATTVTECLHTFCRSCLVKYLEENNTCPTCRIVIHQSHPLQYIGHDRTMQDIVYKLVPGLQEAELKKQRDFYQKLGMEVPGDIKGELCNMKAHLDLQRNGEVKSEDAAKDGDEKPEEDNDYHRSDEQVSICLECNSSKLRGLKRKWIRCSAQATVLHLKKFIAKKLNLTSFNEVNPERTPHTITGHFMQRRNPRQGPYAQICGGYKMEIQEITTPTALQTQDGFAVVGQDGCFGPGLRSALFMQRLSMPHTPNTHRSHESVLTRASKQPIPTHLMLLW
ncbi:hypothetical protein QTP86_018183 [Hemibagrus guttatus]|nr:hypothetical protein QTP86_018183 [Hemibagrus guttatus]